MEKVTFKNEELKNIAKLLLENNYKVLYYSDKYSDDKIVWLIFGLDNNVGNVQAVWSGVTIGTIHKPAAYIGTGYNLTDDHIHNVTLDQLNEAFISYPQWAQRKYVSSIKKYKDIEEYKNISGLKYEYLTLDQISNES